MTLPVIYLDDQPFAFQNLRLSMALGLQGCKASFELMPDAALPNPNEDVKVTFNLGGISFVGRLDSDDRGSGGSHVTRRYSASGLQENLVRDLGTRFENADTVQGIVGALLDGTGLGSGIIGDDPEDRETEFVWEGQVNAALEQLAADNGYSLFVNPIGTLEFIDLLNPPTLPGLTYGTNGANFEWSQLEKRFPRDRRVNRVVVIGGVPKRSADEPDEEERTFSIQVNGSKRYNYDPTKRVAEITEIKLDGDPKTIVDAGAGTPGTADFLHHRFDYDVEFTADPPPTSGTIEIVAKIRRSRGQADDTAAQATRAAKFGGDGVVSLPPVQNEFLETDDQCDAEAQRLLELHRREVSEGRVRLHPTPTIYWPGRVVPVTDGRDGSSIPDMRVQSNDAEFRSFAAGWEQTVQLSSGPDGEYSGSTAKLGKLMGGFGRAGRRGNRAERQPRELPTILPPDFSILINPNTPIEVSEGSTDPVVFTVTVAVSSGFAGPVALSSNLDPLRFEVTFAPQVVNGAGVSTLSILPVDGAWTDPDEDVTGTVTGYSPNVAPASDGFTIDVTAVDCPNLALIVSGVTFEGGYTSWNSSPANCMYELVGTTCESNPAWVASVSVTVNYEIVNTQTSEVLGTGTNSDFIVFPGTTQYSCPGGGTVTAGFYGAVSPTPTRIEPNEITIIGANGCSWTLSPFDVGLGVWNGDVYVFSGCRD